MSREIKFRAWDGEAMHVDIAVGSDNERKSFNVAVILDGEDCWYANEPFQVVMQYTGLKDKNGVDIYEGDIVRAAAFDGSAEVRWRGYGFGFYWDEGMDYTDPGIDIEVIGNIYENKETSK